MILEENLAIFVSAKYWKQSVSKLRGFVQSVINIYTAKYYVTVKKNKIRFKVSDKRGHIAK